MEHFDLCIIGGGPAGYAAAMRAIDFGKKVCLIEKDKVGGAGIYNGALASKAMWEFSMKYAAVRNELKNNPDNSFDVTYQDLKAAISGAVFERKFQLSCHVKLLESESLKNLFSYERGEGFLKSSHTIGIRKKGVEKEITADFIILATGSNPRVLPGIPVDESQVVTSNGIFSWDAFPESMVVVGAGVIGCEFATIFSNFGKTRVFLIDKGDRILPFEDQDIADLVSSNLEKNGAVIHRNSRLESLKTVNGKVHYVISGKDGKKEEIQVEKALVSVGRVPLTKGLGLENVGVEILPSGHIRDHETQTNIKNIYAVGDLTAQISLVNVGELQGRYAVEKIFGKPRRDLTYENISSIMFLNPEVAVVGLSEISAMEKGIPVRVVKIDYSCIARAIAMRKPQGFFKIIVSDDDEMRMLGMRAIGEHASSAIQTVSLLISMNKGIDELADLIHPHPSIIEGIQECVRMLRGKSIFKPAVFKDKLSCYRLVAGKTYPLERPF